MVRYLTLGAIFICFCSFFGFNPANEDVVNAARAGLPAFLKLVPVTNCQDYGFPSAASMQHCTVGKPFQMLSLSVDFYRENLKAGKNYLMIGKEWRVPVITDGDFCTLLTVVGEQPNMKAQNLSGAELARQLQQATRIIPPTDDFYLLRVFQLSADFFVDAKTSSLSEASYIPLPSALEAMPTLRSKSSFTLGELLPVLKAAITSAPKN